MDAVPITDQKKTHLLVIPYPSQSHIKCMFKLARLLHHKGLHITFINTQSNHRRLVKSVGTRLLDDVPGFQFKTVPDGVPSATTEDGEEPTQDLVELWSYIRTNFFDSIIDVVSGLETPVTCIVSDAFMSYTNMIYAGEKLGVPVKLFWTMAACGFMAFYQAKVLAEKGLVPLQDESYLSNGYLDKQLDWIPGMEGIRLKDLPESILCTKPNDPAFEFLLETAQAAHKVSHMIIHTFEELETRLVKEIKSMFPNIYNIGPLQLLLNQITEKETKKSNLYQGYSLRKEEPECIQWLQSKQLNSVVYVNFGSVAVMCLQDLVEFGWGLVNSNHYFLWIIRTDLVDGEPPFLPQELEDEVKKKGFIASWCLQEEVLNHPSVGGFLTHGGWGSIIESLSAGKPMICWPISWEQHTNCRKMCTEWKVGLELGKNVKRGEVEKLVRMLMEGGEEERLRMKAMEWKMIAETATSSNGASTLDMERLFNQIIKL